MNRRFGRLNFNTIFRYTDLSTGREDFGAFFNISRTFGNRLFANANYDTLSETSRAEFSRRPSLQVPDYDYRLSVQDTPNDTNIFGNFGYQTNRFETDISLTQNLPDASGQPERTNARFRAQSGIAYADGKFGFGRDPSRGFYLVDKHGSLSNAQVVLNDGNAGPPLGQADIFGPAVIQPGGAYRIDNLTVGVKNAPPGYNIGDGRYYIQPGARTGTRITVGSAAFRTVVARRSYLDEPLALAYGSLRREGSDERTPFFTNRTGRAAFNELQPGTYVGTVAGKNLQFTFTVGREDPAYVDLGEITVRPGA